MTAVPTRTVKQLAADFNVRITAHEIPDPPPWHDGHYAGQGWECKLWLDGRSMPVRFWMGPAHVNGYGRPRKPRADEVLDCLLDDASTAEEGFEEWCMSLGLDSDSRKAYGTYSAVQTQTTALRHLLGSFYDQFMYAERD